MKSYFIVYIFYNFQGKDYIIEALHFHLLNNSDELIPFIQISRIKPRQYSGFHKV